MGEPGMPDIFRPGTADERGWVSWACPDLSSSHPPTVMLGPSWRHLSSIGTMRRSSGCCCTWKSCRWSMTFVTMTWSRCP